MTDPYIPPRFAKVRFLWSRHRPHLKPIRTQVYEPGKPVQHFTYRSYRAMWRAFDKRSSRNA